MRPPIHSQKHYVQFPISDITTGIKGSLQIAKSVATVDKNLASEVEEGSIIKAVYVELWLLNDGNDGEFIAVLVKDTKDGNGPSFSELASLNTYVNKKNVLFTTQGLTQNDGVTGPIPVMRGFYKIPKSKQRFGLGDTLNLTIANVSAGNLQRCGFTTYKEYT